MTDAAQQVRARTLRRKLLLLALMVLLLFAGVRLVTWWTFWNRVDRVLASPDSPRRLSCRDVLLLSEAVSRNHRNRFRRDRLQTSWPYPVWSRVQRAFFPERYIRERIVRLGKTAAYDPFAEFVTDFSVPFDSRWGGLDVVFSFDDPRQFKVLGALTADPIASKYYSGQLTRFYLPLDPPIFPWPSGGELQWLQAAAQKDYGDVVLSLLDARLADPALHSRDSLALRFLNRYIGYDIDEHLAKVAPEALAFRNRELARGYDPLNVFQWPVYMRERDPDDRGVAMLYPDPADQRAFIALYKAFHFTGRQWAPFEEGWRDRLTSWYSANRPLLKYDPARLRFVVPDQPLAPTPGQPPGS